MRVPAAASANENIGGENPHLARRMSDRRDAQKAGEHRSPPSNLEAEQALLGALLVNNEAIHLAASFLEGSHFLLPVHGRIYDAIMQMVGRREIANPVTLRAYFENDEALEEAGGAHLGLPLGIRTMEESFGGLQSPDLIVLGGRPGMGKSAFALGIALAVAQAGHAVLYASFQMSSEQLGQRAPSIRTGIAPDPMQKGEAEHTQFDKPKSGS